MKIINDIIFYIKENSKKQMKNNFLFCFVTLEKQLKKHHSLSVVEFRYLCKLQRCWKWKREWIFRWAEILVSWSQSNRSKFSLFLTLAHLFKYSRTCLLKIRSSENINLAWCLKSNVFFNRAFAKFLFVCFFLIIIHQNSS